MALDRETVRKIAVLSRIEVAEDKLDALAGELSGVIKWIEQLNAVNTDGVEPITSVTDMALRLREDLVTAGGMQKAVLANAPEAKEGFFVVPKVVE